MARSTTNGAEAVASAIGTGSTTMASGLGIQLARRRSVAMRRMFFMGITYCYADIGRLYIFWSKKSIDFKLLVQWRIVFFFGYLFILDFFLCSVCCV